MFCFLYYHMDGYLRVFLLFQWQPVLQALLLTIVSQLGTVASLQVTLGYSGHLIISTKPTQTQTFIWKQQELGCIASGFISWNSICAGPGNVMTT